MLLGLTLSLGPPSVLYISCIYMLQCLCYIYSIDSSHLQPMDASHSHLCQLQNHFCFPQPRIMVLIYAILLAQRSSLT